MEYTAEAPKIRDPSQEQECRRAGSEVNSMPSSVEYGIQLNQLLAAIRDCAAVNEAGLHQVKFFFPNSLKVICFSRTH